MGVFLFICIVAISSSILPMQCGPTAGILLTVKSESQLFANELILTLFSASWQCFRSHCYLIFKMSSNESSLLQKWQKNKQTKNQFKSLIGVVTPGFKLLAWLEAKYSLPSRDLTVGFFPDKTFPGVGE